MVVDDDESDDASDMLSQYDDKSSVTISDDDTTLITHKQGQKMMNFGEIDDESSSISSSVEANAVCGNHKCSNWRLLDFEVPAPDEWPKDFDK